jgi:hypothetical protein
MEELLLARFVLAPLYGGPFRVLEQSTHFFLQTDKVSMLRLKHAHTLAVTEPAKQLRSAGAPDT